ncbi:macro domain-containing protein [Paenisporosarcina antarctica]|uniref:Macro domain-containing protein n=1 Tax=Paenisporosarcina antarctica TaxID=417367 RepID=A0A4P6ZZM8_9BACL|nr:macro domain-containing protein [Paenisporosarcina antarctica]QBP41952.1 macro domain-containing protein [Paenisporosarcina antarctica]
MPLEIVRNDITKMDVDAIVNAANSELQMGGGVCGSIFIAAGVKELQKACDEIGQCSVGEAVLTDGFRLQSTHIIHTVGPVWRGGNQNEEKLLQSCYENSLALAASLNLESIAFPVISSGIYGYPKEQALQVAISSIHEFLMSHEMMVYLVVFDKQSFGFSEKLFKSIHQYIDEHYVEEHELKYSRNQRMIEQEIQSQQAYVVEEKLQDFKKRSLEDMMGQIDESFSQRLLRFIDEKGMTDADTYKKANIDRRLFSKIRNSPDYTPLKKTAIAFAIALELDLYETKDLLDKAGYTLSQSSKFDLIIHFFIEQKNYNIYEINEALFTFDQVLLGA